MTRLAAHFRRRLWRAACSLAGGLTVATYPQAPGGRVLVANHTSHADTAALLAAVPARDAPVFAAAADYWFEVWWRRLLMSGLAGGLPVRRHGSDAYRGLLEVAAPMLRSGRSVVVYPEGTRSCDGTVGRFHSGAIRLARDCGVPIVPVALLGTGEVLAKGGHFRTTPMEVRFGTPLDPSELDGAQLRRAVVALLDAGPVAWRTSRTWRILNHAMTGNRGLAIGFGWGFCEAISWPVMAEMALVFLGVANPRRIPSTAAAVTAGSVCGVLATSSLARRGIRAPAPLTTDRMRAAATGHLAAGPSGIWRQALGGIPVKVYAQAADELRVPTMPFAVMVLAERGARMAACAVEVTAAERPLRPALRRLYGPYLIATASGFTFVMGRILRAWSDAR